MDRSKYSLPAGLPTCIADDKKGLKVLQDLFNLPNRRAWQSILHAETVRAHLDGEGLKLKGLSTSQRLARKIIAFYRQPAARWEGWALYCPLAGDVPPVNDHEFVPSFEYAALMRYDPDFCDREFDSDAIERTLGDIIGFRLSRRPPSFEEPALVVWPSLRTDLLRWNDVPSDRQEAVVLATFAVASILDDVRLLRWASERSERLAGEFAFAASAVPDVPSPPANSDPGQVSAALLGPEEVLEDWNRSCDRISEVAADLRSNPAEPRRFNDLLAPVKRLEALQAQILAAIDLRNRQALVRRVADILTDCAEDFDAPWLERIEDKVHALWQLAYCPPASRPEAELKRDLERLQDALTLELRQWRGFEDAKARHLAELSEVRTSDASEVELQLEAEAREETLHGCLAEAVREATSCKRRILESVAPTGREFEPSRDYAAELEGVAASAALVAPPAKTDTGEDRGPGDRAPDGPSGPDGESEGGGQVPSGDKQAGVFGQSGDAHAAPRAVDSGADDTTESTPERDPSERTAGALAENESAGGSERAAAPAQFWAGSWEDWLSRIGDSTDSDSVKPWNSANVPNCPAISPFADPANFAESLSWKLKSGILESSRHTLLALVEFLNSDPQDGRKEWKGIYRELLNYCVRENLDAKDSQAFAFALISLSLNAGPELNEYKQLVDSADRLTAQTSDFEDVKWALELANPFLLKRCPDQGYLAVYLENICNYVSMSGYHLSPKHRAMQGEIQKFLGSAKDDATRAALAAGTVQDCRRLSRFLKGKSVVIYTLQLSAAQIARDRIRAIESSAEIRLLHDKVWSDSLRDPIRNADLCVMVKSAATHAVTEMISRTRNNAGKEVIVPSWKGVHSLIRAIEKAAGLDEGSALASGMDGAGGVS